MVENTQYPLEQGPRPLDNQTLTTKEQIDIILHEYKIVRDEHLANLTGMRAFLPLFVAILGGLFGFILQTGATYLFALIPAIMLLFVASESGRLLTLYYGTMYLGLLEKRVNELAGEPLLFWAHSASFERTIFGKFRLKHPTENRYVTSLNSLVLLPSVVIMTSLFFYGLVKGGKWLFANLQMASQGYNLIVLVIYEVGHISFLCLMLFDILVQQKRVLSLLEKRLEQRMLRGQGVEGTGT